MPPSTRRSVVRFRERAELLDFLLSVADATSETLDLDQLLANVTSIVRQVIPADLFAILLYSEKLQGLRIRYAIGHREEIIRSVLIPLGEGITGIAGGTRQAILVDDVRTDPRYIAAVDAVRSELSVPMVARGRLVGVIDVQSTRVAAYTEHDRALLRLLASRVAVSVDNARLYRRVERQNRTLKVLSNLSQEFSSILALDELLAKVAKTVRALIPYDGFSIYLVDYDRRVLRNRFSQRYDELVNLDNIPLGKGVTGAAVESREALLVKDTLSDPRYIATHPEVRSEVAVPLKVQDRVVGVMDLESTRLAFFTEDHVRTLSLLAPQIASSVENARLYEEINQREQRMEQDLKAARKLQKVLLPLRAPKIRGLEIAIQARPAREITGDVYDFFEGGPESRAVVAFGDVSGKGAAAALYGALVSGLLRTLAPGETSPARLLQTLNETLLERKVDAQYATLLVLLWDAATRQFVMATAGSEPPLVLRGTDLFQPHLEGVPLGLLEDRSYDEIVVQAEPGDTLFFFSDGLEDQLNAAEEDFGRTRLKDAFRRHGALAPRAVAEAVFRDLDAFRNGTPITDDQTALMIRVS